MPSSLHHSFSHTIIFASLPFPLLHAFPSAANQSTEISTEGCSGMEELQTVAKEKRIHIIACASLALHGLLHLHDCEASGAQYSIIERIFVPTRKFEIPENCRIRIWKRFGYTTEFCILSGYSSSRNLEGFPVKTWLLDVEDLLLEYAWRGLHGTQMLSLVHHALHPQKAETIRISFLLNAKRVKSQRLFSTKWFWFLKYEIQRKVTSKKKPFN